MTGTAVALIRCDGSQQIGLGHVIRCLALAEQLRSRGVEVAFAMRAAEIGPGIVAERGFRLLTVPDRAYDDWLQVAVRNAAANLVVADVRDDLSAAALNELRSAGTKVAVIDDLSERRLAADLVFYPPIPQIKNADWTGFRGRLYSGWEWVILRPEFSYLKKPRPAATNSLLVTMGGTDPAGLVVRALRALERVEEPHEVTVVLGPSSTQRNAVEEIIRRTRHKIRVLENVAEMATLMASAALAVCSFGVTAYELAAVGVPAVYVCLSDDHAASASAFVEADIGVSTGVVNESTEENIADALKRLLSDAKAREQMGRRARQLVDGRGATRVADALVSKIKSLPTSVRTTSP